MIVLKTAADEARSVAREELRKLAPNYPTARPGKITSWCRDEASNFVRAFIEQHDRHHATLLQELGQDDDSFKTGEGERRKR